MKNFLPVSALTSGEDSTFETWLEETSCLSCRAAREMLAESKQSRTGSELVGLVLRERLEG